MHQPSTPQKKNPPVSAPLNGNTVVILSNHCMIDCTDIKFRFEYKVVVGSISFLYMTHDLDLGSHVISEVM